MPFRRALPATNQPVAGFAKGAGGSAQQPVPAVFPPDLHDGRHLRLKGVLLLVWALVSFGMSFFARDLQWTVAGWPLVYWIASQGAVLVFMAIVVVYAMAMSHFEREDAGQAHAAEAADADAAANANANAAVSAALPRQERDSG